MILITATGRDQPGMVAALSQKLFEANCNIEDATMTRLSGEFAMILVVAPPPALSTPALAELLKPLYDSHGLRVHCSEVSSDEDASTLQEAPHFILSVYGADKTGLVARVAQVLAAHEVNITDLQTRVAAAHTVYVMIFELELPPVLEAEVLRAALDEVARELQVEYSLRALDEDAL
jgi:glycine cleavage system transcriptional repressor